MSSERAGEFLKTLRCCTFEESIGAFFEDDDLRTHAVGQPLMGGPLL